MEEVGNLFQGDVVKQRTIPEIDDEVLDRLMRDGKKGEVLFFRGGIYTVESDGALATVGYRRWVQIPLLLELGVDVLGDIGEE